MQDAWDTNAVKRFFETLLENLVFMPERIATDQLGSYKAAWNELPALENVKHVFVKSEATMPARCIVWSRSEVKQSYRAGS
jgi:putative transposase